MLIQIKFRQKYTKLVKISFISLENNQGSDIMAMVGVNTP